MTDIRLPQVTDLAETAALYAVLNAHDSEALRIVTAMTPAERARYAHDLQRLMNLINTANATPTT